MKERKALFFDIDGTIWNRKNEIPDSTAEALRLLRQNGHLTFICSGRTRGYIQNPRLLELGFDGIVSGCGTMIEYEGETVFYHKLDAELAEKTILTVRQYGFRPILEGRNYIYMDPEEFSGDPYGDKLTSELGERLKTISGEWGRWEISKLSCATDGVERESCFARLEPYYDYMIHNSAVVEMVPKGYDKATGIRKVCEMLGISIDSTVAFGDGANDMGMIRAAGIGVAMGNGSDELKAAADYVTDPLLEDGIWNACRKMGLI